MGKNSPNDDLLTIIRAMSGSERRYFKVLASQRGKADSHLVQLYDHLVEAGKWDDGEIKGKFHGAAFLKQLGVARTRLLAAILDALRAYDRGRSFLAEFSERMDQIDLLYRRKLLAPCLRLARATQRRARTLEMPIQELGALTWLLRLQRQQVAADTADKMALLHRRYAEVTRHITLEAQLLELHDEMMALLPQQAAAPEQAAQTANALLQRAIALTDGHDNMLESKLLLHYIQGYHALLHQDSLGYHSANARILAAWEALPERMEMEEERTFKIYAGYAESAAMAGQTENLPKTIQKLKRLLDRAHTLRPVEHARLLQIELAWLLSSQRAAEAAALVPQVEAALQRYGGGLGSTMRLGLRTNALAASFQVAAWRDVLRLSAALREEIGSQGPEQFAWLARWGTWVARYELHDLAGLETALRPWLKQRTYPLVAQFAQLMECTSPQEERQVLAQFGNMVAAALTEQPLPSLELLLGWTKARRSGTPLTE